MKKKRLFILAFLLIIFLVSCTDSHQIYRTVFIASVGFERQEDKLTGYFLLSNTIDVGSGKDNNEVKPEMAKIDGKTISEIIDGLRVFSLYVNLRHISSLILHESVMNEKDLKNITDFIVDVYEFDYNNYLFTTKENLEELYSYKNPNNESSILSTILDPVSDDNVYPCAEPHHLLNFLRDYNLNRTILLPLLEKEEIWEKDGEKETTISHRGVSIINKSTHLCLPFEDYTFAYIKDNKEIIYSEDEFSLVLSKYKIKCEYKDKLYIHIKAFYHITEGNLSVSYERVCNVIKTYLDKAISYQVKYDIFNSKYYGGVWLMTSDYQIDLIKA